MFLFLCTKYFQMKWLKATYLYIRFNSVLTTVSEMAFYTDFPQQKKISSFQKHLGFTIGGASSKETACQCRRQKMTVQPLLREDPLEGTETHSSILAWRNSWTEEPGGLQSIGHKVRHDWSDSAHMHQTHSKSCTTETSLGSHPPFKNCPLQILQKGMTVFCQI